ncbi:hypothetical protein R3P38DRAFT_3240402 [Favolaschia claudopus]|uniref:Uncharacterized protein n=1 Tax=Favolaschia claudopus TaxID=2862362 RepID=A0AAV9Z6N5_9AGAR
MTSCLSPTVTSSEFSVRYTHPPIVSSFSPVHASTTSIRVHRLSAPYINAKSTRERFTRPLPATTGRTTHAHLFPLAPPIPPLAKSTIQRALSSPTSLKLFLLSAHQSLFHMWRVKELHQKGNIFASERWSGRRIKGNRIIQMLFRKHPPLYILCNVFLVADVPQPDHQPYAPCQLSGGRSTSYTLLLQAEILPLLGHSDPACPSWMTDDHTPLEFSLVLAKTDELLSLRKVLTNLSNAMTMQLNFGLDWFDVCAEELLLGDTQSAPPHMKNRIKIYFRTRISSSSSPSVILSRARMSLPAIRSVADGVHTTSENSSLSLRELPKNVGSFSMASKRPTISIKIDTTQELNREGAIGRKTNLIPLPCVSTFHHARRTVTLIKHPIVHKV